MIIFHLRPQQIEKVARTFNRRITALCLPLLMDRVRTARNHRSIQRLLGDPKFMDPCQPDFGSHTRFSIPERPANHLQYLQMDGHLDWLAPLDKKTADQIAADLWRFTLPQDDVETPTIERLRDATRVLEIGHAVPGVFWKFMSDAQLRARIPWSSTTHFFKSPKIYRVPADIFVNVEKCFVDQTLHANKTEVERRTRPTRSYILDFHADRMEFTCWFLYLDSEGHHCILQPRDEEYDGDGQSVSESQSLSSKERDVGVRSAKRADIRAMRLEWTDFETWLAFAYFLQRARYFWHHIRDSDWRQERV